MLDGHRPLTKDPKFLETNSGTSICTLRIAVKRAGKQGHDGYVDVKCFDAQADACAKYLKAGRESRSFPGPSVSLCTYSYR